MEQLEQFIGRTLALHHDYRKWSALATDLTLDPEISKDKALGRIPVISMNCGDDINQKTHLMDIVAGSNDQDLIAIRNRINALSYPVMLRWFWEFNLNAAFPPSPAPNDNGNCFQTPDPNASPTAIPSLVSQFTQAYVHVRSVLLGNTQPIPNITFIWNPTDFPDGNYPPAGYIWDYYPGDQYVDWIGFDGYSKLDVNGNPLTFDEIFRSDIQAARASHPNEPVMIGETGACNNYPPPVSPTWQQQYLNSIETELDNGAYPNVHALLYFDAPGHYQFPNEPNQYCDWSLPDPSPAITQFQILAKDPNFTGMVTQSNP